MKQLFIITLLATFMLSCNVHKNCIKEPITEIVFQDREVIREVVIHDTTFLTKEDSSQLKGKLLVDSSGNVSLIPISTVEGDYLDAPSTTIKDNIITIDCKARAQELFAQWKSEYVKTTSNKVITKTKEVPIYFQPTNWQTFLMWTGRTVLLACLLVLIGWGIFTYKKLKS